MLPETLPEKYAWRINHLDSFSKFQAALQSKPQRIAVIGAGMIGTELAEDLCKKGHEIVLIEREPFPLGGMLPEIAGTRLLHALKAQGITCLFGYCLTATRHHNDQYELSLHHSNQGKRIETVHHIVAATGLRIDTRLPRGAGIDHHPTQGICVHPQTLQTSRQNIYALGDAVSIDGRACRFIAPIRAQAQAIAQHIAGSAYDGYLHQPPTIRLKTTGISLTISGTPNKNQRWHIITNTTQLLLCRQDNGTEIKIKSNQ